MGTGRTDQRHRTLPQRVEPPCRHFAECGGCQWQYADYPAQLAWKHSIVVGQLRHLGRIEDPPVRETAPTADPYGYRNRMDFAVSEGKPSLRRRRSRDKVAITECLLMEPALAELFGRIGDLGEARGVTLRVGHHGRVPRRRQGRPPRAVSRLGIARCRSAPARVSKPSSATARIIQEVAGSRFRVTGDAFFQNNTAGAATLVELVKEALAPRSDDTLLDGYSGGGLFGLSVGKDAAQVFAVESDLTGGYRLLPQRHAGQASTTASSTTTSSEGISLIRDPWDIAVVDPPRDGLGAGVSRRHRLRTAGDRLRLVRPGLTGQGRPPAGRGRVPPGLGSAGGSVPPDLPRRDRGRLREGLGG